MATETRYTLRKLLNRQERYDFQMENVSRRLMNKQSSGMVRPITNYILNKSTIKENQGSSILLLGLASRPIRRHLAIKVPNQTKFACLARYKPAAY